MFLVSLNYFRAIAIVLIVAGHCYNLVGIHAETLIEKTLINILTGGTSLFVFISGFLFHHIFYSRYKYMKFMKGKVKNVLVPYFLLSIPIIYWYILKNDGWLPYFMPQGTGILDEVIIPTLKYYWTGAAMTAYWYIPFIMVTFALSPLHILFIRQKTTVQVIGTMCLVVIAIFLQRPLHNYLVLQSVLYFMPVYLIGIFSSIHREKIYQLLERKELILLVMVIILAGVQAYFVSNEGYHKAPFEYGGIDIMFLQKIILSFFFLIFLHRFEGTQSKILDIIASTSFAIFFIHGYLKYSGMKVMSAIGIQNLSNLALFEGSSQWIVLIVAVLVITTLCILMALMIKKILPKYSRYLIGY